MLNQRPPADTNPEPASQLAATMPPVAPVSGPALNRRAQLAQLEDSAQQEIVALRARRDGEGNPAGAETADWLTSSIDWDLSVP